MPAIINDLVTYLIGRHYQGYGYQANEEEEVQHTTKSRHAQLLALAERDVCPGPFFDPEIEVLRNTMKPEEFAQYLSVFQRFLNYFPDEKKL